MPQSQRSANMKMKKHLLALLALCTVVQVSAQDNTPKYSNEFLAIGVGARALGMANAYTSAVNDVTAGYWNPAGLLGIQSDFQVGAMHSEYFAGIAKYDYVGMAKPLDSVSTLGVSFIRFGIDDIPNTIELIDPAGNIDYNRITSFSVADYSFMVSYARKLGVPGLRVGGNMKIIHRNVGEFAKAWGFGLDLGAQYTLNNWRFSAVARDLTSTFNAWSYTLNDRTIEVFQQTGNDIPENALEITLPRVLLGVAHEFKFGQKIGLITELDLDATFDGKRNVLISADPVSIDPHFGLELGYGGFIFVRAGVGNIQRITEVEGNEVITLQPNIGLGLKIKGITIDYALTDIGDQSVALYSNVFSLTFDIRKKKS